MRFSKIFILLPVIFLIACGSDPVKKGDELVKQGKYGEAIGYYTDGLKVKPDDGTIKEKLATVFLLNGKNLIDNTGNWEAAEKNVNKAVENFGEQISPDLKAKYLEVVLAVATGAGKKDPELGMKKLESAEKYLADEPAIKAKISELGKLVIEGYLDKGKKKYQAGLKRPGSHEMFEAEQWLAMVMKIDAENKDAAKMLSDARKRDLGIWDGDLSLPLRLKSVPILYSNIQVFSVGVLNNSRTPVTLDRNKFYILDKNGKRYNAQPEDHRAYTNPLENKTINFNEDVEGEVVFEIPDGTPLYKMVYDDGKVKKSEKYYP